MLAMVYQMTSAQELVSLVSTFALVAMKQVATPKVIWLDVALSHMLQPRMTTQTRLQGVS